MKYILLALLIFAAPVAAQVHCVSSERFGNSVIKVGDSERRVIQVAGRPDVERQLETPQGGGAGIRMDYYLQGRTVQIYVQGGVVTRICRVRD